MTGTKPAEVLVRCPVLFRQLFDKESSTYTYLLADEATHEAVLIDPVLEQAERDLTLIAQLGLKLVAALDTHVHADHITASGVLRERTGCVTIAGASGPLCADRRVESDDIVNVGSLRLRVLATPGHTDDSVSYLLLDPRDPSKPGDRVFSGDALLVRAAGRTDFQNGDAGALYDTITERLFTLPDATLVYPAHDYLGHAVTTVAEEKRYNARIAGKTREQFIAIMNALDLPQPAKIREAVPANQACGLSSPVQG